MLGGRVAICFSRGMKSFALRFLAATFLASAVVQAAAEPVVLWPAGAPGDKGGLPPEADTSKPGENLVSGKPLIRLGNVSSPTITVFPAPADKATGAAALVCPGGAYHILAMDLEGSEVCECSLGRHAYVQKPLTRGVGEARAMRQAAEKHPKSATQMGIQIHGEGSYRTAMAWLQAGVLGNIQEIHSFCGKGWGGTRPPRMAEPPPANLDWDLYCGVSRKVGFIPEEFHPGNWRRWQNFGTGTLGDMACHILDPVLAGTRLSTPLSVVSHLEAPPNVLNFSYNAQIGRAHV